MKRKNRFRLPLVAATAVGVFSFGFYAVAEDSTFFKINKSLQIFGEVFRQISTYYVDDIDPEKFVEAGLDGMMGYLDPYTVYIPEDESEEVDILTTGVYGGLGITVSNVDSMVTIVGVTEGFTADKAGLRVGDRIYAIDSSVVLRINTDKLQNFTRGKPGTMVNMRVIRQGMPDTLSFSLARQEITIKNVSYSGVLDNGVGYIRLERFSRGASAEVREAIENIRYNNNVQGIILDLRDNPGGLLDAAVSISEIFVPTNSLVVSTRGKSPESEKKYVSRITPLEPNLPLAVLINGRSASASEIVAGAIQDLDRGILVGETSFGKGLVQTIMSLPYNANLKITTARYYTPSGRCIQKIDYGNRRDGIFTQSADSLRKYTTAHGRPVYESNGILPDTVVSISRSSPFVEALISRNMLFNFATEFSAKHRTLPEGFAVSKDVVRQFGDYLKRNSFSYSSSAMSKLRELKQLIRDEHYPDQSLSQIAKLEEMFAAEQERELERNQTTVSQLLEKEIYARFYPRSKLIEQTLGNDVQVQTAASLIRDNRVYHTMISPATTGISNE